MIVLFFFLDDANRIGEQKIMEIWQKQYKINFSMINPSLAIARSKEGYNICF